MLMIWGELKACSFLILKVQGVGKRLCEETKAFSIDERMKVTQRMQQRRLHATDSPGID